mmetsp:Transcript_22974/g.58753  ORF Transcript_22974/g.58753 Transcript_22974/m.58753 type:complete len:241 (-) Transcript_22974:1047-1769(-)
MARPSCSWTPRKLCPLSLRQQMQMHSQLPSVLGSTTQQRRACPASLTATRCSCATATACWSPPTRTSSECWTSPAKHASSCQLSSSRRMRRQPKPRRSQPSRRSTQRRRSMHHGPQSWLQSPLAVLSVTRPPTRSKPWVALAQPRLHQPSTCMEQRVQMRPSLLPQTSQPQPLHRRPPSPSHQRRSRTTSRTMAGTHTSHHHHSGRPASHPHSLASQGQARQARTPSPRVVCPSSLCPAA